MCGGGRSCVCVGGVGAVCVCVWGGVGAVCMCVCGGGAVKPDNNQ